MNNNDMSTLFIDRSMGSLKQAGEFQLIADMNKVKESELATPTLYQAAPRGP